VRARWVSGKMLAMRSWLLAPLIVLMLGASSWIYADRIEEQNDFCNACHLTADMPLHLEIRQHFDRVIPQTLAGVHGRGWVEDREESAFRCIDCHAGAGPLERTTIRLLSVRDTLRYAVGAFEEPKGMSFDLSAKVCRGCHPAFRHSAAPGWSFRAFHGVPAHDDGQAPRCVRCHTVHESDGDAFAYFMNRARVDRECRTCHEPGGPMEVPSLIETSRSGG
jgi:hypothetical protein